jgi:hypothetical protein
VPYVPPWLNVQPSDFVQAAQGGARIGAELAGQGTEANIAAAKNATSLQEAQMRENTAMSGQQADAALAQARLEQAAKQQQAEQVLRQWEIQQQIKHQQDALAAENQRAANALSERQQYGNSMLDIRRAANDIAQQRVDAMAAKPAPTDFQTVTETTKGTSPYEQYTINEPGTPSRFFGLKGGTPPTTLTTTNSNDLLGLPSGSTIATNKVAGTPTITTSRKVPIGKDPYALDASSNVQQPQQRIKVKDQSGKLFTIPADQLDDAKKQGYTEVQ